MNHSTAQRIEAPILDGVESTDRPSLGHVVFGTEERIEIAQDSFLQGIFSEEPGR